jgi:hypothetical protein
MRLQNIRKGYLFCTPGLSANGEKLAKESHISWYSLASMNDWIEQTISYGYKGPNGDIIQHLERLERFISQISIQISSRTYYKYR